MWLIWIVSRSCREVLLKWLFWRLIFAFLVNGGRGFGQSLNSAFQIRQVVLDGGLQDRVICVEVAVSEMVTHACDLGPGNVWLGIEHLDGYRFDGLTDFKQAHSNGVGY